MAQLSEVELEIHHDGQNVTSMMANDCAGIGTADKLEKFVQGAIFTIVGETASGSAGVWLRGCWRVASAGRRERERRGW